MDILFYNLIRKMVSNPENFKVVDHDTGEGFTFDYIKDGVFKRSWYVSHQRFSCAFFHKDFTHSQCVRLKEVCLHVRAMQLRNL